MRIAARILLLMLLAGCSVEPPNDRWKRDQRIGITENGAYRFVAEDGLLHVTDSDETALTVRASAAEFSARISRRSGDVASVLLRIANLPDSPVLRVAGVDVPGAADRLLDKGWSWTLSFPPGVDELDVIAPSRSAQGFRFIAMGDIQRGVDRFGDMVDAVNLETDAEFVLLLGDLTSRTTPEEFRAVERHFANIRIPIYATPGNHDVFQPREYQDRFGRANYSFGHRGVRFTSVDSSAAYLTPGVWDWVSGVMRDARSAPHVVFQHIPVTESSGIRSGQWSSRREASKFVAMARRHRVDLLLFGHIHSYRSYSLAGIPTFISGGCGAIPEKLDGFERHYLRVDVSAGGAIDARAVEIE